VVSLPYQGKRQENTIAVQLKRAANAMRRTKKDIVQSAAGKLSLINAPCDVPGWARGLEVQALLHS
jgi:hypothetical protein